MWYFTYDHLSNWRELMRVYRGLPSRVPLPSSRRAAVLRNHRICFPAFSEKWAGGIASVNYSAGKSVSGALFDLPKRAIDHLDEYYCSIADGAMEHVSIQRIEISVHPFQQGPEFLAVTHQIVAPADAQVPPAPQYLDLLIRAAVDLRLSSLWIEQLRSFRARAGRELLCRIAG